MKYTFIEITNFKGIENVKLDFDIGPKSNVYTLVGLNESGKTTILEGINLLTYRVLDYTPSKLENVPDVLMLEGKNDFYTIKYFLFLQSKNHLNILPGTGAGSLTNVIQHYIAWGKNFIILLDSDKEGKVQKKRYEDLFGKIMQNRIFMLSDIDTAWKNIGMEKLFNKDERLTIQKSSYPNTINFNKLHFNRSIQELLLTKNTIEISLETKLKFEKLVSFISGKFKEYK